MKTVTIEVTREDIRHGSPCDTQSCPVARAIRRQVGPAWVDGSFIRFFDRDVAAAMRCPRSVMRFIQHFDKYKSAEPFKFKLTLKPNVRLAK